MPIQDQPKEPNFQQTLKEAALPEIPDELTPFSKRHFASVADWLLRLCRNILQFFQLFLNNFFERQGMYKSKRESIILTQSQQTILDNIVSQNIEPKSVLGVLIIRELVKGKDAQEVSRELEIYKSKVKLWQKRWIEATENFSDVKTTTDDEQLIEHFFGIKVRTEAPQPNPIWENQFQETNYKVSDLESQSLKIIQRLQRIENKVFPPLPPLIKKIVNDAHLKYQESLAKDEQEFNNYYEQAQRWATMWSTLSQDIEATSKTWEEEILPECRALKQQLPKDVQEKLTTRHELLELSNRILLRLRESVTTLEETEITKPHLIILSEENLIDFLDSNTNEESARKAIDNKLKPLEHQRYKRIREVQDLAETRRQQCMDLVKKKVLPILDNIDEGEQYSHALVEELIAENSDHKDILKQWLGFHKILQKMLLNLLDKVRVSPIEVEIGSLIDYNRHEPLDVEKDSNLPNEHIKEVLRRGYEYITEEGKEPVLLREAQVVVVKN